jgi:hypothetical protein
MICPCCQKREPRVPQACDPCRSRLAARLWELSDLHAVASAALAPGSRIGQRVTGSRERALPLAAGVADLLAPVVRVGGIPVDSTKDTMVPKVRVWTTTEEVTVEGKQVIVTQWHRELVTANGRPVMVPAGDQTGQRPVAVVLDSWVRDWIETRAMRETRPAPTVPQLRQWLANRLGWACDHHPAIDEFATEVTQELYALRAVLAVSHQKLRLPYACPACEHASLVRDPGGGEVVECQNCDEAWEHDQFGRLATVLASERQ